MLEVGRRRRRLTTGKETNHPGYSKGCQLFIFEAIHNYEVELRGKSNIKILVYKTWQQIYCYKSSSGGLNVFTGIKS